LRADSRNELQWRLAVNSNRRSHLLGYC
jgi:hypothetical protein